VINKDDARIRLHPSRGCEEIRFYVETNDGRRAEALSEEIEQMIRQSDN